MSEGEFEKTINAFERELIKQKFWPQGMRNLVRRAKKEFPKIVDGRFISDEQEAIKWFLKYFGDQ